MNLATDSRMPTASGAGLVAGSLADVARPLRILDLFCGGGGAAMGLHRAFPDAEIVGVDIRPQPRYPFAFECADAMSYPLDEFDFIWASPPCQAHSSTRFLRPSLRHESLIEPTRARLEASGTPWIMENVVGAPLRYSVTLCGLSFGLRVYRHRRFEAPFLLMAPCHLRHTEVIHATRDMRRTAGYYTEQVGAMVTVAGHLFGLEAGRHAMGIDWMSKADLAQAIPPAYSEYLAQFIPMRLPIEAGGAAGMRSFHPRASADKPSQ